MRWREHDAEAPGAHAVATDVGFDLHRLDLAALVQPQQDLVHDV